MGEMGMRSTKSFGDSFGAMALYLFLLMIFRIDQGARGFCPPVITVGSGAANLRFTGETVGLRRRRPLGSTAEFGHHNDELIQAFQHYKNTHSHDATSARNSFVAPEFPSSSRGFGDQGMAISEPGIIDEEKAFFLQQTNDFPGMPGVETAETLVAATNAQSVTIGETPSPETDQAASAGDDSYELVTIDEVRIPSFAMPGACPPAIPMLQIPTSIKKMLRSSNWTAPLAQIAIAYQPGLKLEHIREISVGAVDETHIDLEALVCEDDTGRCVMLEVPVDFPTSCIGAEDTSKCILDNIQQVSDFIKAEEEESELFLTDKTLEERERLLKDVLSPKFIEYPNWWSMPIVLAGECNNLRTVLNDVECQPQLQRLFRKNSSQARKIIRAGLVAVGPCGVILRALDSKNQLHEVPIAFLVPATDAERLRAAVLELFG